MTFFAIIFVDWERCPVAKPLWRSRSSDEYFRLINGTIPWPYSSKLSGEVWNARRHSRVVRRRPGRRQEPDVAMDFYDRSPLCVCVRSLQLRMRFDCVALPQFIKRSPRRSWGRRGNWRWVCCARSLSISCSIQLV